MKSLSGPVLLHADVANEPARFHVELALGADGALPTEFCLFKSGANATHDGRGSFLFDDLSAKSCETKIHERGIADFAIDYDHASLAFISADPSQSAKAAGWFKALVRDGALWACDVSWTPAAAQKLKDREFRYYSPAANFETTPEGDKRITKLINCAITNNPALAGLQPLVASTKPGAEPVKESIMLKLIQKALALSDTATEADAAVALNATIEKLRSLVAFTGRATADEALGVITGWKAGADQVADLTAKLSAAEKAAATAELDQLIKDAKTGGKLSPAMEAWARTQPVAQLKAFLEVAPKLVASEVKEPGPTGGTVQLSAEEAEGCKKLGIDTKKYLEHKNASASRRS